MEQARQQDTDISILCKEVTKISQLLKRIEKLEANRSANCLKLVHQVEQLESVIASNSLKGNWKANDGEWLSTYSLTLQTNQKKLLIQFTNSLSDELHANGLQMEGQIPELRAGLLTLVVDLKRWKVELWYGPKQEKLEVCDLGSGADVAKRLTMARECLGRQMEPEKYRGRLCEAVRHANPDDSLIPYRKVCQKIS